MSDIKNAYGAVQTLTKTNANLASSATAGWQSDVIDNTTNLYADILVAIDLAAVNSAPANSAAIFLFVFPSIDGGTKFASSGDGVPSGTEGTMNYPSVATVAIVSPQLGVIPYPTQNKELIAVFSVAAACGGVLPPKFALGMVNYSGMTLNVTSIKWMGVYKTVI